MGGGLRAEAIRRAKSRRGRDPRRGDGAERDPADHGRGRINWTWPGPATIGDHA